MANTIAIRREDTTVDQFGNPVKNETVVLVDGSNLIKENDILILVGRNSDLARLEEEK